MLRSLTPNSPLKKLSSPPFSFFLQKVQPDPWNLLPRRLIQKINTAMAIKIAPPTPTTTPTMILLVLLNPPELPLLLDELSEAAEGSGLDVVITEV